MDYQNLLSQIAAVSQKYELVNKKTGGYFNIFNIANIETDEVIICRVIYELINPYGSHYQGDIYLRLFIKYVLHLNFSEQDYKTVSVYREYETKGKRRIDLVITTAGKLYPLRSKFTQKTSQNNVSTITMKKIHRSII